MDFLELLQARYSVRNFAAQKVEPEKLQKILEAGRLAPTAVNAQPQRIFLLESREAMEKLRSVTSMAYNAPAALLVCYDRRVSWKAGAFGEDYDAGEMDATIVTTAMMMEAASLGLGTLWARGFHSERLAEAFALPPELRVVCVLDVGYPAKDSRPSERHLERLPLEKTVRLL